MLETSSPPLKIFSFTANQRTNGIQNPPRHRRNQPPSDCPILRQSPFSFSLPPTHFFTPSTSYYYKPTISSTPVVSYSLLPPQPPYRQTHPPVRPPHHHHSDLDSNISLPLRPIFQEQPRTTPTQRNHNVPPHLHPGPPPHPPARRPRHPRPYPSTRHRTRRSKRADRDPQSDCRGAGAPFRAGALRPWGCDDQITKCLIRAGRASGCRNGRILREYHRYLILGGLWLQRNSKQQSDAEIVAAAKEKLAVGDDGLTRNGTGK